ncbi:MAG: hypothetical protein JO022_05240 [Acidobacteriaceae bacterium]|nr:hypothetical protein [Acidobacteriaceae bacterium]
MRVARMFVAMGLIANASVSLAQAPYGIHARPTAADYAASQTTPSATYAASVVPRDEVKHLFAVDISSTYLVLEVACYPSGPSPVTLSADNFLIKSGPNSEFIHPADAVTVAAVIQEKNTPRPPSASDTHVTTTAAVGYESVSDPSTGRKAHAVYTEAGTAVSTGSPDPFPPGPPPAGSTPYDRVTLQQQLAQRALQDGTYTAPVAGLLYFPAKEIKRKNGGYELEYSAGGPESVHLQVPVKR